MKAVKTVPLSDMDYVQLYAEKLKSDPSLFASQKLLIDSQLKASHSLFSNAFGPEPEFRKNARAYLRKVGLLDK